MEKAALFCERQTIQLCQSPYRIIADMIGSVPGRTLVKEFKPGRRVGGELRIALNLALEFSLELRIFLHHLARKLFKYIGLAIFLLLEYRIEKSPGHG